MINHKCRCGETDPAEFYDSSPYTCKKCRIKVVRHQQKTYNTRYEPKQYWIIRILRKGEWEDFTGRFDSAQIALRHFEKHFNNIDFYGEKLALFGSRKLVQELNPEPKPNFGMMELIRR